MSVSSFGLQNESGQEILPNFLTEVQILSAVLLQKFLCFLSVCDLTGVFLAVI